MLELIATNQMKDRHSPRITRRCILILPYDDSHVGHCVNLYDAEYVRRAEEEVNRDRDPNDLKYLDLMGLRTVRNITRSADGPCRIIYAESYDYFVKGRTYERRHRFATLDPNNHSILKQVRDAWMLVRDAEYHDKFWYRYSNCLAFNHTDAYAIRKYILTGTLYV